MTWQPPRMVRSLDDPVTGFQVLGERSSGTNFVHEVLRRNLAGVEPRTIYGWKHGFIDRRYAPDPGLLTVVVYRHPIRWLQSVHARPLHLASSMAGLGFGAFVRHPWQGAFLREDGSEEPSTADMDPKTQETYPNPMRARAAKIAYFEEMARAPGRIAYIRFEDMNRDPRATLAALARGFALTLGPYAPVATFKGTSGSAYIPKPTRRILSQDRRFIAEQLDNALECQIGYDLAQIPRFDGLSLLDRRSLKGMALGLRSRSGGTGRQAKG